jgi:hypothetical protein
LEVGKGGTFPFCLESTNIVGITTPEMPSDSVYDFVRLEQSCQEVSFNSVSSKLMEFVIKTTP